MRIVIPVKSQAGEESEIALVKEASVFALVDLGEGMQIENLTFIKSFENELFDYIVACDKNDEIDAAFDLGARALLAHPGMSIEEVVEALMFRELDEIQ